MFADPQSITVNAATSSLPRVGSGDNTSTYLSSDGNVKLTATHSYGKRTRRVIRVDHRKIAADPLNAAQNLQYNASMYIVVDAPPVGYTPTELKYIWDGLLAQLAASSAAVTVKFLGGES